jgi:HD superfamily phosphohydrolase
LKKTFSPKFISHMVSSQLDCDRMDYLLRDSYQTGTAYGLFALQRILTSLEVDTQQDRMIVVGEKGQMAVEDYLFSRYSMYSQVYYHRKNLAARAQLARILKRAQLLGDKVCFLDEQTSKLLRGAKLSVTDYLFLDDVQMTYHIKRWVDDKDKILSDLTKRFLNRDIFHTLRLHNGDQSYLDKVERKARDVASKAGFDPDYYVCIERTGLRPYDYYRPDTEHPQTNIMVRTDNGEIRELSSISQTVEALVRGSFDTVLLAFPAELRDSLAHILS